MQSDFKKDIIRLMQSTKLLQSPLSELSEEKKGIAYNLLNRLVDGAVDENYTMLDYMQMARLYYNLGELSNNLFGEQDNPHYKKAIQYLAKGGIDLSMNKWLELISLRAIELRLSPKRIDVAHSPKMRCSIHLLIKETIQ